ncbi:MAG: 4-hydroxy 2-oxovalerate aldolase [Candidatus Poribacteria bacterium]|nr:4-hydroxy 2-oxovalerate aldolase [Candidatus Poribacteria bacterium]
MFLQYTKSAGKEVGIHTHNNQQLAYANTIEALIHGANRLDASLAGLGRGAGNCPTELLVGFLHNPKFRLRPLLQCIRDYIEPMRDKLRWGFGIPYMITGLLNQHPREAMKFMEETDTKDIVSFFDSILEEE